MVSNLKFNIMLAPLVVFLLLAASSSARLSMKASESEIQTICSKTKNSGFCLKFLKSKPETAKADLPDIAKFTVDSAHQSASETLKQIQSLLQKAADPHSKEVYTSCSANYDNAVAELDDALKALAAGDPGTLNIKVSAAMTEADTCKGDLKSVSPVQSSMVKEIQDLENVCSITLVISNMLPK